LELNGNAVIGYKQYFDFEEDTRKITVRSIGTAVRILDSGDVLPKVRIGKSSNQKKFPSQKILSPKIVPEKIMSESDNQEVIDVHVNNHWRSNDPILVTSTTFPHGSIATIGGYVCATSVKVFENDEKDTRETWWTELRDEIKSHAQRLQCTHVIGYTEQMSYFEGTSLLLCSGTAVELNLAAIQNNLPTTPRGTLADFELSRNSSKVLEKEASSQEPYVDTSFSGLKESSYSCRAAHISYSRHNAPFPMSFKKCAVCKKKYVPEIMLTSVELPTELEIIGKGVLTQAYGYFVLIQYADRRKSELVIRRHLILVSQYRLFITIFTDNSCTNCAYTALMLFSDCSLKSQLVAA
jgi:hypothetical protein